jgi:hypothetical protein
LLRHHGGDRFRRRLERGGLTDGCLDLPELHETEKGDDRRGHRQHQKHSLRHE